jgi:iron-sulfur cluster assembly protein
MEPIQVTEKAADWISKQLSERGKGLGVRLGVKPSGCSGYKYIIEYADHQNIDDTVTSVSGVNVYVDSKSAIYLSGSRVDFKIDGINSGIEISNPKAIAHCGCGESFAV